jgi:hypothetical protein
VEACGNIVGISEKCGHALTWRVLTSETNKVINCSVLRPANLDDGSLCAETELLSGKDANTAPIIHSRKNDDTIQNADQPTTPPADYSPTAPQIYAENFVRRTFHLTTGRLSKCKSPHHYAY